MSGIFKSVKKAFKKVGKVIKKIAPVLIVAAAVYFGGSYLMASAGGASAQAAASVGTSFTKSAGMWKSFLGGLSSGTASKSAVAFAEGSFKASQAGMALSGQVAAGTASVNNLATMGSVGEAVSAGVNMAQSAFSSGADPQSSWGILWNGLNDVTAPAADAAQAAGTGLDAQTMAQIDQDMAPGGLFNNPDRYMADANQLDPNQMRTEGYYGGSPDSVSGMPAAGENPLMDLSNSGQVAQSAVDPTKSATGLLTTPASTTSPLMKMIQKNSEERLQVLKDANDLARETIAARTKADEMKLWMTGGGMLLNTFGQFQQAGAAEKERQRSRSFVPHKISYDPYKGIG